MKQFLSNASIVLLLSSVSFISIAMPIANSKKIGKDLYDKQTAKLQDIPESAINAIKQIQPDFIAKEVEKEFKHGKHYLDVEGVDKNGEEIEFDMLMTGDTWQVVEIQKDLSYSELPQNVVNVYQSKLSNEPDRIIESKQMTGIVIYEFYLLKDNTTDKHEIKVEGDIASFLDEEWQH